MAERTRTIAPISLWRRIHSPFSRRDLLEGLLVAGRLPPVLRRPWRRYRPAGGPPIATPLDVINLQRSLGFFWEDDLNEWVRDRQFWAQTANIVYFWLHFPLIIVFGIYLYIRQRSKYTLMRDAFLTSGAIALVILLALPGSAAASAAGAGERVRWWRPDIRSGLLRHDAGVPGVRLSGAVHERFR